MAPLPKRTWTLDDPLDESAALAFCEAIAFGRSFGDIENDQGLPPRTLFMVWVMRHPEVAQAFHAAREVSSYIMEDEAIDKLRNMMRKPGSQAEIRLLDLFLNWVKWSTSKRNPKVFSDKAAIDITVPIQINTSLDMANTASGTKDHPNIYELKAQQVQELEPPPDPENVVDPVREEATKEFKKEKPKLPRRQKRLLAPRVAVTELDRAVIAEKVAARREKMNAYHRERNRRLKGLLQSKERSEKLSEDQGGPSNGPDSPQN